VAHLGAHAAAEKNHDLGQEARDSPPRQPDEQGQAAKHTLVALGIPLRMLGPPPQVLLKGIPVRLQNAGHMVAVCKAMQKQRL